MANTEIQTLGWGSSEGVRDLDKRLAVMLPGGSKLTQGDRLALAQASVAHGLDPLNGEVWLIPGRGLMIGIKGLRKKAHEQVHGNYWVDFRQITEQGERQALDIPEGALAFEAKLYDTENLSTYGSAFKQIEKLPWEVIKTIIGDKPYTAGLGVLKRDEQTKMQRAQCAMKRAEADAIKRRFDVPFGVDVEDDAVEGNFEPAAPADVDYTDPDQVAAQIEATKAGQHALFGE